MKYWIKQRINPQLGVYYVGCGQRTKKDAKQMERPLYGDNIMHPFDTEEAYTARLRELQAQGERVQIQA